MTPRLVLPLKTDSPLPSEYTLNECPSGFLQLPAIEEKLRFLISSILRFDLIGVGCSFISFFL